MLLRIDVMVSRGSHVRGGFGHSFFTEEYYVVCGSDGWNAGVCGGEGVEYEVPY